MWVKKENVYKFLCCIIYVIFSSGLHAQQFDSKLWDLNTCITYATQHNIQVSQAYLQSKSASIKYNQSKAERLPNLSGSVSQTFTNNGNEADFGITSNVTLYNGRKISYTINQKKLTSEQKKIQIDESRNSIILSVTEAYLQTLYYKENIVIAEKVLESAKKELERSKAKFEAGSISTKDLSDIESEYAQDDYNVIKATNNYKEQLLVLKQLLELPPGSEFTIVIPEITNLDFDIPDAKSVYDIARNIMPEIKSAKQQLAIDSLDILIAKSSFYPTLSLTAGISTNAKDFIQTSDLQNNIANSLQLKLSVPIFNRYETKSEVAVAQITSQYNILEVDAAKKDLYKKIENAQQDAISYKSEMASLQKVEEAALKSYELAQQQFNYGAISATDLLLAETTYVNASTSLIQAKYMTLLYYQVLQFYQGKTISL